MYILGYTEIQFKHKLKACSSAMSRVVVGFIPVVKPEEVAALHSDTFVSCFPYVRDWLADHFTNILDHHLILFYVLLRKQAFRHIISAM